MDAQRRAFLDTVVDDLTASLSHDPGTAPAHHAKGLGVKRAAAGALLAAASFFAFSATAAHADPPARTTGSVIQASNCFSPDFVPWDHTKICPGGLAFMSYDFLYAYSPNQATVCYMFDATYFGCGGPTYVGQRPICGFA